MKSWRGVLLDSPQAALRAAERTHTQAGLRVTARISDELGRACSKDFREIKDN